MDVLAGRHRARIGRANRPDGEPGRDRHDEPRAGRGRRGLYAIALSGKSGIGGGIVTVSPGKGGLGTFAPPLDAAGNSVKGALVAHHLSQRLGLNLFLSPPEDWRPEG